MRGEGLGGLAAGAGQKRCTARSGVGRDQHNGGYGRCCALSPQLRGRSRCVGRRRAAPPRRAPGAGRRQYDGLTFDDYDEADRYVERLGFPELLRRAVTAVQDLPDGFVVAGFSNGGGMAEYVATQRRCSGAVLISGALPVAMLGATGWPRGLPAQIHYTVGDPRRRQEWLDELVSEIKAAGAAVEVFDYPGTGHLFTDPSRPDEYDETATELLWTRALAFCASPSSPSR